MQLSDIPPEKLPDFAEICGIHAGDGWMSSYNTEVGYGTSVKEEQYFDHVFGLYDDVLDFDGTYQYRIVKRIGKYNCVELRIASKEIQEFFQSVGFPRGSKCSTVVVPDFIQTNVHFMKSFLRGAFDTDGTAYWRDNGYGTRYLIMHWTTTSPLFAEQLSKLLIHLGFNPRIEVNQVKKLTPIGNLRRPAFRVVLARKKETERYRTEIGSRNHAKLSRMMSPPGFEPGIFSV